jgi:aminopeptidase N
VHRIAALLAGLALVPPAVAAPEFPIPTPEQREELRKSHLRIPGLTPAAGVEPEVAMIVAAQDDVDIQHYLIAVEFIPTTRSVIGSVTVTGKSLVPGFQHLVLDLATNNMSVASVLRGSTNLSFSRPPNLIDIILDDTFDPGETFTVRVNYSGTPDATGFGSINWRKTPASALGTAVSTLSEPQGARSWWPCKDRPDDKATVEEWWTVPASWIATGNGVLIDTVPVSGGTKLQYRWKPTDPLTTYLVSVAATVYETFSHTYTTLSGGTMPVDYYVYPEDLTDAQTSFSETPAMIRFFAETFGEYPFVEDKYGMSEFSWGGAMEHTTNTSYGYQLVNGLHTYDYVIAHELAHQWWGDALSPQTWNDIWLNEGFASFCEALWAEHVNGVQGYKSYMNSMWRSSFSGPLYAPSDLFGATVYDKGAWVQHMLRQVVGDDAFFDALRDWYVLNDNGVVNTAQWQSTVEARHGGSLDWFFQEWVYQPGQPRYEYGWTTAALGDGTFRTYVRIRQTQGGMVFTMPVEFLAVTDLGDQFATVWNDEADQVLTFLTTSWPYDVQFDANAKILKTSTTVIPLADADMDGVPDTHDNCSAEANPVQQDHDLDGAGDACDPDDDNDGLADAGDCAPLDALQGTPAEVGAVTVGVPGHVAWSVAAGAETYDVQRGTLLALRALDYGSCLATGIAETSFDDPGSPAEGEGYFYLVGGRDAGCGGPGTLGTDAGGAPRPAECP